MKHLSPALLLVVALSFGAESICAEASGLNVNTATADDLTAVPNMDEDLVGAAVNNRPSATFTEPDELPGTELSNDELQALFAYMFVPINLNTADESEILMFPGVGGRMAHEFEEYRPYSDIEQFRQEIGEYVDDAEVAVLEQYLTLD